MPIDDDSLLNWVAAEIARGTMVDWDALRRDRPHLKTRLIELEELADFIGALQAPSPHAPESPIVRETPTSSSGGFRWGPLEVLEEVGRGRFGCVYRAHDSRLDRIVALKLATEDKAAGAASVRRFLGEARRLARVDHPNVLRIHGADIHDDRPGYWTDFVEGTNLERQLDETGPMEWRRATHIGLELSAALEAVHASGLLHGDVTTSNVMRGQGGRILLTDFGAAIELGSGQPRFGTAAYLAPEVLAGEMPTRASDYYSLGVLLYRLVTAQMPIAAVSYEDLLDKHARGEITKLSGTVVLERYAAIVDGLLEPNPMDRAAHLDRLEHDLRDCTRAESTPATRSTHVRRLPVALTSFVGRSEEVGSLSNLLSSHRCVTLTGTGGVGKTRLALEVARGLESRFDDGIFLAELASLENPHMVGDRVQQAVLAADARPASTGESPLDRVAAHLASRTALLVLDNCEHVVEACAQLASTLLDRCPLLRILATSRTRLRVAGERVVPVRPLAVPTEQSNREDVARAGAVQLLVDRAGSVATDLNLHRDHATIAAICHHLDGLPLAIELAASQLASTSADELLRRLSETPLLDDRGPRDAPARHRSLDALLEWSYDLLAPDARRLFERLSVFAATWDIDTACTVAGPHAPDARKLHDHLVEHSLIECIPAADGDNATPRYRMLEVVKRFARDRLEESGDAGTTKARFVDHHADVARELGALLAGAEQSECYARLDQDSENLRTALELSCRGGHRIETAAALLGDLLHYWADREPWERCLAWANQALDTHIDISSSSTARARARLLRVAGDLEFALHDLQGAGRRFADAIVLDRRLENTAGLAAALIGHAAVDTKLGNFDRARQHLEESIRIYDTLQDSWGSAQALDQLAVLARQRGRFDAARVLSRASRLRFRHAGDWRGVARELHNEANYALATGAFSIAGTLLERALTLSRDLDVRVGVARSLNLLARVDLARNDAKLARSHIMEALRIEDEMGDREGRAVSLLVLGRIALDEEDFAEAFQHVATAVRSFVDLGERQGASREALWLLAALAAALGRPRGAAAVLGVADQLDASIDAAPQPALLSEVELLSERLNAELGEEYSKARARGSLTSLDDGIEFAVDAADPRST